MGRVLQIILLGSFRVVWGNELVRTLGSRRLQALLAYLLLARRAPLPRRQIAFQFWPNSPEAQAFANLRTLVTHLRRALPEANHFLDVDTHTIHWRLDAPYELDVDEFERAVARGSLHDAVELYHGDLLPDCYDDWILSERQRLRLAYRAVLEELASHHEARREYELAIGYARCYLEKEPLDETACVRLMRLYALHGDRAAAIRVFEPFTAALRDELGIEPGAAIREAYARLLRLGHKPTPAVPATDQLALVGRNAAWQQFLQSWRQAAAGGPRLLLLSGESGIGKTRLLEEMKSWARRQGVVAAYARSYAAQGRLAYAPLVTWLRRPEIAPGLAALAPVWRQELARLVPEIVTSSPATGWREPVTAGWQRMRLFEALGRAFLSVSPPLLLLLDDLQWADPDTIAWLSYVLRLDPGARLLVVAALRPEEPSVPAILETLRLELQREELLAAIELEPLGHEETRELAGLASFGAFPPEQAEQLYTETEGNPLFIVETIRSRYLQGGATVPLTAPRLFGQGYTLPHRVEAVIAARLKELGGPAHALAALAATAGRQFDLEVLSAAWKSSPAAFAQGLDELLRRRVVRAQPEAGYDFAHDKIRDTVYRRLNQAHRKLLHRTLAQALESVHARDIAPVSGEIAAHYERAGFDRKALPYYLQAGEFAASLHANQEAIGYFRRGWSLVASSGTALAEAGVAGDSVFQLLTALGDVLERVGEHDEARSTYNLIFDHCPALDPVRQAQTYRRIGVTWLAHQHYERSLEAYDSAGHALAPLLPPAPHPPLPSTGGAAFDEWLNIFLSRLWVHYYLGEPGEILEQATAIAPHVSSHGTPRQRADLYTCLAGMEMRRERYAGSAVVIDYHWQALEAAREVGDEALLGYSYFNLGFSHLWAGRLAEAELYLLEGRARAEKTGDESTLVIAFTYLGVLYRRLGRLDDARALIHTALETATRGQRPMYVAMALANQAWLAWRAGDTDETQRLGAAALAIWQDLPIVYPFQWTARWPMLAAALLGDDLPAALDHAAALLSPALQAPAHLLAEQLRSALACRERGAWEPARQYLAEAVRLAGESGYL